LIKPASIAVAQDILNIQDLSISFDQKEVVSGVNLRLKKGMILGIVGESGSGKTLSARAILKLIQPPGLIQSGSISYHSPQFGTIDLLQAPSKLLQKIRGQEISMIFQEPGSSLNPVFRCGTQVREVLQLHLKLSKQAAKIRSLELFEEVGLQEPLRMFQAYPHQLSGGQKQRVMIAMAMATQPEILIADEPTTSLDVGIQAKIIELLRELQRNRQMSMIFITHDLGVLAKMADEVAVMQAGKLVETGTLDQILTHPQHPYTQALLACRPQLEEKYHRFIALADFVQDEKTEPKIISSAQQKSRLAQLTAQEPLWEIKDIATYFKLRKSPLSFQHRLIKAVDGLSFQIFPGETLGLIGESGSGKTTLGRSMLRLLEPQKGEIFYRQQSLLQLSQQELRKLRKDIQIIFQDPFSSLNPRITIGKAIQEPMRVHGLYDSESQRKKQTIALLERVGLQETHYDRYPHAFSGGERQRICIARALALAPQFIICDECASSLDVSVQAQILNLLKDLQDEKELTYLFISHDLRVVRQMSDRIMVMKAGKIVEIGDTDSLIKSPQHPYTQQLIEEARN